MRSQYPKISEAIKVLRTAQSKHLIHTDATTVRAALEGLGIVRRSLAGADVHRRVADPKVPLTTDSCREIERARTL